MSRFAFQFSPKGLRICLFGFWIMLGNHGFPPRNSMSLEIMPLAQHRMLRTMFRDGHRGMLSTIDLQFGRLSCDPETKQPRKVWGINARSDHYPQMVRWLSRRCPSIALYEVLRHEERYGATTVKATLFGISYTHLYI